MTVGITAVLVFLFYVQAIPVEIVLKARSFPKPCFTVGTAIFEGRFALRQAEKRLLKKSRRRPSKKSGRSAGIPKFFRSVKFLIRHAKIEQLTLTGSIGMQDAAATAMLCGCAEAARAAIAPLGWSEKISLALTPDFSGEGSRLDFSGMFSISLGHIIGAALLSAVYLAKGRLEQWKSIRLKTS